MISVERIALVMISALLLLITFCLCGNSSDGGFTRNTDSPAHPSNQPKKRRGCPVFSFTDKYHSALFISDENGEYIQPEISNIADNTEIIKMVRSLFESDGTAE